MVVRTDFARTTLQMPGVLAFVSSPNLRETTLPCGNAVLASDTRIYIRNLKGFQWRAVSPLKEGRKNLINGYTITPQIIFICRQRRREGANMSSENEKSNRDALLRFRVSPEEESLIKAKMEQAGIISLSAYLRKMAIDGYVIKLELPEMREMVSLLRRASNNLNQIARRSNTTDRIYAEDMEEILRWEKELWQRANEILRKLAAIA